MKKNQKALIRHNLIYQKLQAGEIVNVKDLADEFGVGVRTIQKDMNERLNGIYDIEYLGEGNYRLKADHRFKGASDEEESIAISLMKALQHSAIPELNDYIDAALPTSSDYEQIFTFGMHFETIVDVEAFKTLIKAIKWKVGVEFVYTKADGSSKTVLADPYRLANFQNYWYLVAYDSSVKIIKTYYLKNISELHMLYENFTADEKIEEEINRVCSSMDSVWWNGERQQCMLKVSGIAKYYIERDVPDTMELLKTHEEYLIVRMYYHNEIELFSYVKSWIPHMRIVDNDELMEKLMGELKSFLETE
jgi:predicted DNA-binding transcriptional regulator YafY